MKLYKVRIEESRGGEWVEIPVPLYRGVAARIQTVFYGNESIKEHLRLRDADGDEFITPLHGQPLEERGVFCLDSPIAVKLPISYFDEDVEGKNKITIWGEMFDLE